jgi:hypothetical protein
VKLGNGQSLEIGNSSTEFPAFEVGQQLKVDLRGLLAQALSFKLFVTFRDMNGELLLAHHAHDERFFADGTLSTPDYLGVALSFAEDCTLADDPCTEVTTRFSLSVDTGMGEVRTMHAYDVEELHLGSSKFLLGFSNSLRYEGVDFGLCGHVLETSEIGFTMVRQ